MAENADKPLSVVVEDLAAREAPRLSLDDALEALGPRAFGGLLFVLAMISMLPLPPGATTVLGLPMLILSPQLVWGRQGPWLPRGLRRQSVATAAFARLEHRIVSVLRRIEALSKPRLDLMVGRSGRRVVGLVCSFLAFMLMLPIPFGNMVPAAAVGLLSLGLIQRDGVIVLAGYVLAGVSAAILALSAHAARIAVSHLLAIFI